MSECHVVVAQNVTLSHVMVAQNVTLCHAMVARNVKLSHVMVAHNDRGVGHISACRGAAATRADVTSLPPPAERPEGTGGTGALGSRR